jgi:hypothetical protein
LCWLGTSPGRQIAGHAYWSSIWSIPLYLFRGSRGHPFRILRSVELSLWSRRRDWRFQSDRERSGQYPSRCFIRTRPTSAGSVVLRGSGHPPRAGRDTGAGRLPPFSGARTVVGTADALRAMILIGARGALRLLRTRCLP